MTGTVLVVDDSPEVLAVVSARLRPEGHRVLVALDWELGMALASEEQPDIILLDVEMPVMSGLDLCRRLKSDPRTAAIPVIFLTAHADVSLKVHGLDLGAADYITKPFHTAELRARVRVAMRVKKEHEELGERARFDGLTGLLNRRELDRTATAEVATAVQTGRDLSVVLIDLDRFKSLNDTFGHGFGDQVLREVGSLLARSVRGCDCAARYGGEELALVLPATDVLAATDVAARIRTAIRSLHFAPGGVPTIVTASFGVAGTRELRETSMVVDVASLFECADAALYAAKREGRDRVVAFHDGYRRRHAEVA